MSDSDTISEVTPDTGWYSNDAATFGDRVAAARDALAMSRNELARRLGVKLKTIQSWEEDIGEPRANKLQMLSGILNVSIPWLLTGQGNGLDEPGDASLLDADVVALLAEIRQIKSNLVQTSDRLGALEKRLRKALQCAGSFRSCCSPPSQ